MKTLNSNVNLLVHVSSIGALTSLSAFAQTKITWDGDTDTNYITGTNWVDDVAPADDLSTNIAEFTGGTVDLTADRSVAGLDYTTGTTFQGAANLTLGTSGIEVNGNSFLSTTGVILNNDITITFAGGRLSFGADAIVSGTGKVTTTGTNTLYIDGTANTYSGGTEILAGSRVSFKGQESMGTGTIHLDNGRLEGNGTPNMTLDNAFSLGAGGGTLKTVGGRWSLTTAITGTGPLTVDGGNNFIYLDVSNTFTGDITIKGSGILAPNSGDRLGDAATNSVFLEDGGRLHGNGNVNLGARSITLVGSGGQLSIRHARSMTLPNTGSISGSGQLLVGNENGVLSLQGANSFSGGTEVQGIVYTVSGALGAGDITLNNIAGARGTLQNNDSVTTHTNNIILDATNGGRLKAGWNKNLILNGVMSGSGGLIIGSDSGTVVLGGANTFTGNIAVESHTSANVDLRVTGSLGSGNYGGEISGDGDVEFAGADSQTLTGANTYTGTTTVSNGCLILGQAASIPASGVGTTVAADAGLGFDPAGLSDAEIETIIGNVTWDVASELVFAVDSPNTEVVAADFSSFGGDTIVLKGDGTLDLSGATIPGGITLETPDGGTIDLVGGVTEISIGDISTGPGTTMGQNVTISFTAEGSGDIDVWTSSDLQGPGTMIGTVGSGASPFVDEDVTDNRLFYILVTAGDGDPFQAPAP